MKPVPVAALPRYAEPIRRTEMAPIRLPDPEQVAVAPRPFAEPSPAISEYASPVEGETVSEPSFTSYPDLEPPVYEVPQQQEEQPPPSMTAPAAEEPRFAFLAPANGDGGEKSPSDKPAQPAADQKDKDQQKQIGEKPSEDANRLLLKASSVVLPQGDKQSEIGGFYSFSESLAVAVLPNGVPVLERVRTRTFRAPMSVRYGLTDDLELFGSVPFGVGHFERDNVLAETRDMTGVLGDISFGCIRQLRHEHEKWPDITLTLSASAPTGPSPFRDSDVASLGGGFWSLSGTVNFVESYDPIVVFGGLGYSYSFAADFNGATIQPGDAITYYFGIGFGVSDDVSLSAQVSGSWVDRLNVNGVRIPDSDQEPISMRFAYLRRLTKKDRIQPFVEIGLTNDASDATLGVLFIHDK